MPRPPWQGDLSVNTNHIQCARNTINLRRNLSLSCGSDSISLECDRDKSGQSTLTSEQVILSLMAGEIKDLKP